MNDADKSKQNMPRDPLLDTWLGDYHIHRRLAAGGMSRIYQATDTKLQREVAIKVLDLERFRDDQTITERFKREARAVGALQHDNIITVYQYGEDPATGIYFLAMQLVTGSDLAQELKQIRKKNSLMPVPRALDIMRQIAHALDYAHSQGIIHRDVKPSNILLDTNDKAILTDLGLVLRSSVETTLGTAFGTPRYIAPEQATSSDQAVAQSDLYSLAVILYEILTGKLPFDGTSPMEIALAHINKPPTPPRDLNPNIPLAAEQELLRALAKTPEKRQPTVSAFIDAVAQSYSTPSPTKAVVIHQPVAVETGDATLIDAELVKPQQIPSKTSRNKNRMLIGLTIAALLMVLVATALALRPTAPAAGGAPVTLIYDENSFTLINEGDYTLDVQPLKFVRGIDDNVDDFSGDRIPGDILPPERKCFQIMISGAQPVVPPQCRPIQQYRQGQEILMDAQRLPWRTETHENNQIVTFAVMYDGREITRCDTVATGEAAECRFTWPVPPPTDS